MKSKSPYLSSLYYKKLSIKEDAKAQYFNSSLIHFNINLTIETPLQLNNKSPQVLLSKYFLYWKKGKKQMNYVSINGI